MLAFYLWLHNFSHSYNLVSRDSMGNCLECVFQATIYSRAIRRPRGREAEPHTHMGKKKETHKLIFSWLS